MRVQYRLHTSTLAILDLLYVLPPCKSDQNLGCTSLIFFSISLRYIITNRGDNGQPCLRPLFIAAGLVVSSFHVITTLFAV
uniref:Putative u6 snrna-associated sm-like protein lsm8 isoform x1 n=1 Tax=Ixodes ricinus TaxID=34613 RepID=A0A147BLM7_IXORI